MLLPVPRLILVTLSVVVSTRQRVAAFLTGQRVPFVLHNLFERASAPFVKVHAARQRLHAHLEVLHFDAQPRRFDDEVVDDLEIQIEVRHHLLLNPLQQRMQHHQNPAARTVMPMIGRRLVALLLELHEQVRPQSARIRKLFEFHAREPLKFRVGVVGAALLTDARPDLFHDLLDIDRVRSNV